MSTITIAGFKFFDWAGGKKFLIIESDRLRECIDYCRREHIVSVAVSPYHGYLLDDVDFLSGCPHVRAVYLQRELLDYCGLYSLPNLQWLSAIFRHSIDFSKLPSIQVISTDWNPSTHKALISSCSLAKLWLRGYKPQSSDLSEIRALGKLVDLHLLLSPIKSVSGIESLSRLKKLGLSYCPRLRDITSLLLLENSLQELEIDHCKQIQNLDQIRALKNLRKAILADSGVLPSLKFIEKMPRLEFLSFVGMNVLDGDMTPCLKLKYAGFLPKRHYSHTSQEIARMKRTKGIGR